MTQFLYSFVIIFLNRRVIVQDKYGPFLIKVRRNTFQVCKEPRTSIIAWNTNGKFNTIKNSKKNIVINKNRWDSIRYYRDFKENISYMGKIIGNYIDSPDGILFL